MRLHLLRDLAKMYAPKILKEVDLGVPLGEVRMAADPLTTTARGALAAALSEA